MTYSEIDVPSLRAREFPWAGHDGDTIYLNNASTGPLPSRTVTLGEDWVRRRARPWTITDHDAVFPALRDARQRCAALVGATESEIALTPNTSYGLSLAAQALPLADGDVVVTPDGEFPTVIACWRTARPARELRVHVVRTANGLPDESALIAALDETGAKALAVSWVSFAHGTRLDLQRLGDACRSRGVLFIVDAMQGLGALTCDVIASHVDLLACGGFKWLLAPWGAGFTYVRRELIGAMNPPALGWLFSPRQEDYTRGLDAEAPLYDDARRFEVMTLPSQDMAGLGCSIGLLQELGATPVAAQVERLATRLVERFLQMPGLELVTPADPSRRAGIVSVRPADAERVSRDLRAAGVFHSLRRGMLRFSPHCYNTLGEVDEALDRLRHVMQTRQHVMTS